MEALIDKLKYLRGIYRQIKNYSKYRKCKQLSLGYQIPGGYQRIYHYHIRKAGGTSLNKAFLNLSGGSSKVNYARLCNEPDRCLILEDKVFVGWDKFLIEKGDYFYAFSHIPAHKLKLPKKTFTITIIRNPVDRLLSHYKMLIYFKENKIDHACLKKEGRWIGKGLIDFLDRIPKEHLLRQLYMFSDSFDVDEAYERIISCSFFFFTENFRRGVLQLSKEINCRLEIFHTRRSNIKIEIDKKSRDFLMFKLEPELILYKKLLRYYLKRE